MRIFTRSLRSLDYICTLVFGCIHPCPSLSSLVDAPVVYAGYIGRHPYLHSTLLLGGRFRASASPIVLRSYRVAMRVGVVEGKDTSRRD
jgi:hypothetical protein